MCNTQSIFVEIIHTIIISSNNEIKDVKIFTDFSSNLDEEYIYIIISETKGSRIK